MRLRGLFLLCAFFALSLLIVSGCVHHERDSKGDGLTRCKNCGELEGFIKQVAASEMEREVWDNYEDTINGRDGYDDDIAGDDDAVDDDVGDDDDGGGDDSAGDDDSTPDHSGTNVQEEGVDEADLIKTDGYYLYYLNEGALMVFDVWPPEQTAEIAELNIEGEPIGIFLYKDWVLVLTTVIAYDLPGDVRAALDDAGDWGSALKLAVVNVSDPSSPIVEREVYVAGEYVGSRRIEGSVRIVVYTNPPLLGDMETWIDPWDYYHHGHLDKDALRRAYESLIERNRSKIEKTPLDEFIPHYYDVVHTGDGDDVRKGRLSKCEDFYVPRNPFGRGVLTVITIVFDDPTAKQDDIAVVAEGTLVYASKKNLYVTGDQEVGWDWGEPDRSEVHMFDIHSDPTEAIYLASGWVDGWALNQFSMSEYDGFLRIATTVWDWENDWWDDRSNAVSVLERDGGDLKVVGEITDIARGEDIYAVRFLGERGFVVTFMNTDPLFTIDLSDPCDPKLVGELEIPGFSNYIHPMGKDHLLTIGENGDEWGGTWGVALNIFDVSDFADPELAYHEEVGGYSSYSPAQSDHHAFLYYNELLSIPLTTYGYDDDDDDWKGQEFYGFVVYRATPTGGFEHIGDVDHSGNYGEPKRSAIIENYLYTVSDSKLIVTELEEFEDVVELDF